MFGGSERMQELSENDGGGGGGRERESFFCVCVEEFEYTCTVWNDTWVNFEEGNLVEGLVRTFVVAKKIANKIICFFFLFQFYKICLFFWGD